MRKQIFGPLILPQRETPAASTFAVRSMLAMAFPLYVLRKERLALAFHLGACPQLPLLQALGSSRSLLSLQAANLKGPAKTGTLTSHHHPPPTHAVQPPRMALPAKASR